MRFSSFSAALLCVLLAAPALAQEDTGALYDKLERLERDVSSLQKQAYRRGGDGTAAVPANSSALEVRMTQMAEEMRQLRGMLEQSQFTSRQAAADVKKLSDDMEYRMRALEEKSAAAAAAPQPAPVAAPAPLPAETPAAPAKFEPAKRQPAAAAPALTGNDFPDANSHYSGAFKLLNEKKYAEASASFDQFVKKYPTDPLAANAYYWLGESYYARADYTRSADSFRKGFEANTEGQKAPDNLYKLAKSLVQVKRTPEACVVLTQLSKKYGASAPRVSKLADDERTALQCK